MHVSFDNINYVVRFQHLSKLADIAKYESHLEYRRFSPRINDNGKQLDPIANISHATVCTIFRKEADADSHALIQEQESVAFCYSGDRFDKKQGLERAFTKALDNCFRGPAHRKIRSAFWDEFWNEFDNITLDRADLQSIANALYPFASAFKAIGEIGLRITSALGDRSYDSIAKAVVELSPEDLQTMRKFAEPINEPANLACALNAYRLLHRLGYGSERL